MPDQRVGVALVATNAGFVPKIAASTAEVNKLTTSLDKLAISVRAVGESTDAASIGVTALGRGAAEATAGMGALGKTASEARAPVLTLVTNLDRLAASTLEAGTGAEMAAKEIAGLGVGAGTATTGTASLGRSSAVASAEVTGLGRSSAAARSELTLLGTTGEVAGGKMKTAMAMAAKSIPLVTIVAAAEFAKMAGDFQQETNVLVTAAGESQAALASVRKGILDIATSTGTRWQDLVDGMYQVEKAGYRGADGLKVLKAAAQAAREEGANLATVTAATTSVMASYHIGADGAVGVTNAIKTAAGEAKTTMEAFSNSLSTVLPLASANKVSFADVAGSLASLTQHGTTADEAAQELAFTLRGLSAPSNVAVQAMNQLGISSTDVALSLGDGPGGRGLAGTLNYLSETVLQHMGPAGLVLLGTFKESATAGKDMQIMLDNMPPRVRLLSEQFKAGTISLGDYRQATKDLPADQAALAGQYVVLANKANGFNDAIRRGGPDAATYSAEIKAMTGGAAGLNTVLQMTGESMAGTNERIAKIAAASVGAGKDVQGWASTQDLFNVKMAMFSQTLQRAAIDIGTKLLPALSDTFGFLGSHQALLEVFAVALVTAGVAITTYTVGVKLASAATATWGAITGGVTTLMDLVAGRTTLMAVAFSAETRAKIASTVAGLRMNTSLAATAPLAAVASGAVLGLGTALKTMSIVGVGALAAFGAAGLIASKLEDQFGKARPSVEGLTKALLDAQQGIGPGLPGVGALTKDLDGLGASVKLLTDPSNLTKLTNFETGLLHIPQTLDMKNAKSQLTGIDQALTGLVTSGATTQAAAAFQVVANAAKDQGVTVEQLTKALPGYHDALLHVQNQAAINKQTTSDLTQKTKDLDQAQGNLNTALQDSINKFTILNQGALTTEQANDALATKTDALAASVKENGRSLDLTTAKTAAQRAAVVANRQAVIDAMQASNDKITADFKAAAATGDTAGALAAATKASEDNRGALIKSMTQAGFSQAAAKAMADQFLLTPAQITTNFNTPGVNDRRAEVQGLQQDIEALKDKSISITASVAIGSNGLINTSLSGKLTHLPGAKDGGRIGGGPPGVDTVGPVMLDNGEHVWTKREVAAAGGHGAVEAMRRGVLGMANGGPVVTAAFQPFDTALIRRGLSNDMAYATSTLQSTAQAAANAAATSAVGGAGGAARWEPVVAQVVAMLGGPAAAVAGILSLINKESGGNPNAINLTDSNARAGHPSQGLMQTIPGTFAANAGPYVGRGITDPLANIYAGVHYAVGRYGWDMLVSGGRHTASGGYLGYDQGGEAHGVGFMAKNVIAPERVLSPAMTPIFRDFVKVLEKPDFASWVRAAQIGVSGGSLAAAAGGTTTIRHEYALKVDHVTDDSAARAVSGRVQKDVGRELALAGLRVNR